MIFQYHRTAARAGGHRGDRPPRQPDLHGGVAIGAVATSFLFMLLLFLRMSTTGGGAGAGAQNPQALARAFMQPLLLALLAGERSSCCAIR